MKYWRCPVVIPKKRNRYNMQKIKKIAKPLKNKDNVSLRMALDRRTKQCTD